MQNKIFEPIIEGLSANGYVVCDDFLSKVEVAGLMESFTTRYESGSFKEAGVGKSVEVSKSSLVRGDEILWLESDSLVPAERVLIDKNQIFIDYINQTCFLGIKGSEIHFAKYGVGKFYRRHRDTFQTQKGRVLSVIVYLNNLWVPEDGGNLIIYTEKDSVETAITIAPLAGRLVCFESEKLEHEVTETFKDRYSVTGWFLN
jgi:SM-20-related protein